MNKWYMTVGVPGGDFACKSLPTNVDMVRDMRAAVVAACDYTIDAPLIRDCPPDLAEWLDYGEYSPRHAWGNPGVHKVPGGWLVVSYAEWQHENGGYGGAAIGVQNIPVAGAAGITVLPAEDGEQR